VVTPADHANTVRDGLQTYLDDVCPEPEFMEARGNSWFAALDALLAQAEQAHAALRQIAELPDAKHGGIYEIPVNIARAALEGWDEEAFVGEMHRRAALGEAWTHEDRMVLGEGGC
jgi:hypothetical protein